MGVLVVELVDASFGGHVSGDEEVGEIGHEMRCIVYVAL